MEDVAKRTKPFNIRMPVWAIEYIDRRSREKGITKTDVVVEALWRLRAEDLRRLMKEGYEEMRESDRRMAEGVLVASRGSLDR